MIHDPFPDQPLVDYRVSIGHFSVKVAGRTRDEAIKQARRKLCHDLPRMWDVIQSLDDNRFEVAADTD